MGQSAKKYHHFRSYRIRVPEKDSLHLHVGQYKAHVHDINLTGLSFSINKEDIKIPMTIGEEVELHLQYKKLFKSKNLNLKAQILRKFTIPTEEDKIFFGVNFTIETITPVQDFLEHYLQHYDHKALKKYLIESSINENYSSEIESIEFLGLFREVINNYFKDHNSEDWDIVKAELLKILPYKDVLIWTIDHESGELKSWPHGVVTENNEILNNVRSSHWPVHFRTSMPETIVKQLGHISSSTYPLFFHSDVNKNEQDQVFFGIVQFVSRQRQFSNDHELLTSLLTNILSEKLSSIIVPNRAIAMCLSKQSQRSHSLGHSSYARWLEQTMHKEANTLMPFTLVSESHSGQTHIYDYLKQHYNFKDKNVFCLDLTNSEDFHTLNQRAMENGHGIYVFQNIHLLTVPQQEKLLKSLERIKGKIIFESPIQVDLIEGPIPKLNKMIHSNIIHLRPLRQRQEDIMFIARQFLKKLCVKHNYPTKIFSKDVKKFFEQQPPYNILELEGLIEKWFNSNLADQIISPFEIYAVKGESFSQLLDHSLSLEEQMRLLKYSLSSFQKTGNHSH